MEMLLIISVVTLLVAIGSLSASLTVISSLKEKKKKASQGSYHVLFHRDARNYTPHGTIVVNSKMLNVPEQPVVFAFEGIEEAPALTLDLITQIYEQAYDAGYNVRYIESYEGAVKKTEA